MAKSKKRNGRGLDYETNDDEVQMQELVDETGLDALDQNTQGPTLIWEPAAKIVSGVTGLGSFYVRASSKLGGWGVAVGREATLKGLEVSRSLAEYILVSAGRDVASRSSEYGRNEADGLLERSVRLIVYRY